jgi:hypothetical protein
MAFTCFGWIFLPCVSSQISGALLAPGAGVLLHEVNEVHAFRGGQAEASGAALAEVYDVP